jgi:hypothetical protein
MPGKNWPRLTIKPIAPDFNCSNWSLQTRWQSMLAGLQPGNCPPMHLPLVAGTVESVAGRNSLPAIAGFLLKASLIATFIESVHKYSDGNLI